MRAIYFDLDATVLQYGDGSVVDAMTAAFEAGAHKPDSAPSRLVERRLPADAYALVGDTDADVDGAERAGWDAPRYDGGQFGDVTGDLGWA